jgi:cell shape-determining protein MreC
MRKEALAFTREAFVYHAQLEQIEAKEQELKVLGNKKAEWDARVESLEADAMRNPQSLGSVLTSHRRPQFCLYRMGIAPIVAYKLSNNQDMIWPN